MGRPKKYQTEEEQLEARRESQRRSSRRWYQKNKEKVAEYRQKNKDKIKERVDEYNAEYYQANKEAILEHYVKYQKTQKGRAVHILSTYRQKDKKYNRGECTLTPEWIVENIFSQPCHYCGETDWTKIGCDRIDNALPHTPDNVVPCCGYCNKKKGTTPYTEYMRMIGKIV